MKNITLCTIVVLILVYAWESEAGSEKDSNHKHLKLLSPACVNAYWPINDDLTSPFGPRDKSDFGYDYDFHEGIDIRAQSPLPVQAFADGTVRLKVTNHSQLGNYVILEHIDPCDNTTFYTLYAHFSFTKSRSQLIFKRKISHAHVGNASFKLEETHLVEIHAGAISGV